MKVKHLLSDSDKSQISATVEAAERRSGSEIVPMIVDGSDDYADAKWRAAIVFSLFTSFAFVHYYPYLDAQWIVCFEFISLVVGYVLGHIYFIKKIFIIREEARQKVHRRAMQAFLDRNIHVTTHRTGILIFLSLLERRAEILCDVGIHKKVHANEWNGILNKLLAGVKVGQTSSALCTAIAECGELVHQHFPPNKTDTVSTKDNYKNELSNSVVLEDT